MPELPDLTVFAENLEARVRGERVAAVTGHGRGRLVPSDAAIAKALVGSVIDRVERWGKEIRFRFDHGHELFIHLMLTGGFTVSEKPGKVSFPIVAVEFESGKELVVHDPKGLAVAALDPERNEGVPDALEVDAGVLKRLIAKKPRALIKGLLIDQKVIRGIGNAYADEILWAARISPKSVAGRIPEGSVNALAQAIPAVLHEAIRRIREDRPGTIGGEYRDFLAVHNPERNQSPTGHRIAIETVASKKTYFTDEQVLYH